VSQAKPHIPSWQVAWPLAGSLQATPHAEQLPGSVAVSTQRPPQLLPLAQLEPQLPALQTSPAAHGRSQPPQCLGSPDTSTHRSPHLTKPGSQMKPH
jgi:hypothetical protein